MTEYPESKSRGSAHPSDEELLCFLDAELSPAEKERVRTHIEGCEVCQADLSAFKEVLGSVQEFRDTQVAVAQSQQTNEVVDKFRVRLGRHIQEKTPSPVHATLVPELRRSWNIAALFRYRVPILASVVAFALVLATTLALRETTASADILLTRSEQRDTSRSPADSPVSRAVLHIRVFDANTGKEEAIREYVLLADSQAHEARLESVSHEQHSAVWSAAGNDFWGALSVKVFAENPFFDRAMLRYMQEQNFFPDAAATQFRKLVANRGGSETNVRKGEASYGLDYVFAEHHPSRIRNAILWVSKESYDPFQLSIFVGSGNSRQGISDYPGIPHIRNARLARCATPVAFLYATGQHAERSCCAHAGCGTFEVRANSCQPQRSSRHGTAS